METKQCPNCGGQMSLKEKEGSKFWGCKNWATRHCKTQRYEGDVSPKNAPVSDLGKKDGISMLADEVVALRGEVKELIALIKESLSL